MKKLFKLLLFIALFFAVEKLIRTQTHGFRYEKIQSDFEARPDWEIQNSEPIPAVLNQRFHFLNSGVQCYAFESDDHTTVLKVFKHYHLWPSSKILRSLGKGRAIVAKRERRIDTIFRSAKISLEDLSDNTGVFYLNLNKTYQKFPPVEIYDNIGVRYTLDLNTTPFLLQKKAELLSFVDESIIDSYFHCIHSRMKKGYTNADPRPMRNLGICNGNVIEIDIGSFVKTSSKWTVLQETYPFKQWISQNQPELREYFDNKLKEVLRA